VEDGDLIVMTSHGRSGVRRWLLASVAEKLIQEVPVPVILVPVVAGQSSLSATTPGNGS
jgi:nucleotide-binding universal stress UspA family protein